MSATKKALTPEQIRVETYCFIGLWLTIHPEDADVPDDVLRRIAAGQVIALAHEGHYTDSEIEA